jgi:putative nucleotidyltransferase with HDIG domain
MQVTQSLLQQLDARREIVEIRHRAGPTEGDSLDVALRWGNAIECTDQYTEGHCARVADVACALAVADGISGQALFWFHMGALLHDVGKIGLPAEVLNKPGCLTAEEWVVMRGHPSAGVALLAEADFPWDVTLIVQSHHERWDGTGYPHGLMGQEIPRVARLVAIADAYDALTSVRSYRAASSHDEAMAVMRLDAGRQFDPMLFAEFERVAAVHAVDWGRQHAVAAP